MGKMKSLRLFIAEDIAEQNKVLDLDEAFVLANSLWDKAVVDKDRKAIDQIVDYIHKWEKGA